MMPGMKDLYQQVIMDHNRNPRNFGECEACTASMEGRNPLCGDHLEMSLRVENDILADVKWKGMGCAISKSSASLMSQAVIGKPVDEVRAMIEAFHNLITREAPANMEILGKLKVFSGVGEFPARVKCATLAWRTLEAALDGSQDPITTE